MDDATDIPMTRAAWQMDSTDRGNISSTETSRRYFGPASSADQLLDAVRRYFLVEVSEEGSRAKSLPSL
jgi:hypothetical protein